MRVAVANAKLDDLRYFKNVGAGPMAFCLVAAVAFSFNGGLTGGRWPLGSKFLFAAALTGCSCVLGTTRVATPARLIDGDRALSARGRAADQRWSAARFEIKMQPEELKTTFDQQAAGYDKQWAKMAPIRDGLHFLLGSVFADLPVDARILCVGLGTGAELAYLAQTFPQWTFTAVEPSGRMLDVCRCRAEENGYASRCHFHEGYLDSLPIANAHDAATCFLVSQFILEQQARSEFFSEIAYRLRPGGILASADLASEVGSAPYDALLKTWMNMMAGADVPPEKLEQIRAAYGKDVAVLPAVTIASIIESGGFELPVQFFQAGLLHAWFSKRAANSVA